MKFRLELVTARERRALTVIASVLIVLGLAGGVYLRPPQQQARAERHGPPPARSVSPALVVQVEGSNAPSSWFPAGDRPPYFYWVVPPPANGPEILYWRVNPTTRQHGAATG